jgi:hypothetical protein
LRVVGGFGPDTGFPPTGFPPVAVADEAELAGPDGVFAPAAVVPAVAGVGVACVTGVTALWCAA